MQKIVPKVAFANDKDLKKLQEDREFGKEDGGHIDYLRKIGLLLGTVLVCCFGLSVWVILSSKQRGVDRKA